MKKYQLIGVVASAITMLSASRAHAVTCGPQQNGACFEVDGDEAGFFALAVVGNGGSAGVQVGVTNTFGVDSTSTNGKALYGQDTSSGYGVYGVSSSGVAVYGVSNTANGVVGQNWRTDWNAAAISALPGNSNGLAIYAGGGAQKPGGGSWTGLSDARVKKDIKGFRPGLAELERLRPVRYRYNGLGGTQDDGHEFVGVIAQELEQVMPEMIQSTKMKLHPGDAAETDIKRVDPSAFTYVLINAVQEQQKIIDRQNERIAKLERGPGIAMSSIVSGGVGGLGLCFAPLGLVFAQRRRRADEKKAT